MHLEMPEELLSNSIAYIDSIFDFFFSQAASSIANDFPEPAATRLEQCKTFVNPHSCAAIKLRIFTFYNVSIAFCWANVPYESQLDIIKKVNFAYWQKWETKKERAKWNRKQVTFECARFYFLFDLMISSLIRSADAKMTFSLALWISLKLNTTMIFLAHLIQKTWCHNDSLESLAMGRMKTPLFDLFLRHVSRAVSRIMSTSIFRIVLLGHICRSLFSPARPKLSIICISCDHSGHVAAANK